MGDLCSGSFFPPTIISIFKGFQIYSTSIEGKHDRYNNIPTVILHCVNILHLVYPLISWWTIEFSYLLDVLNNADVNTHLQVFGCMLSILHLEVNCLLISPVTVWVSQVALAVKNPANTGDMRYKFISGSGRSDGRGHGNPFQYSCLENHMDREARWVTVHRVAKSQTRLKWLSTHAHSHSLAWIICRITKSWLQIFYF